MRDDFSLEDVAPTGTKTPPRGPSKCGAGPTSPANGSSNPAFLAFVGDVRGQRVLNAGCGEGYNTRILARRGARMTGIDLSERMIALARAEERREPLGIDFSRASYTDLATFGDASFDAVVSFMSLMDGPRFDLAIARDVPRAPAGRHARVQHDHPCFLTKDATWLLDEQGVKIKWMVGNYFDPAGWVERWRFTDAPRHATEFAVPCFGRTLSEYVNTLIGAGYVLERIEEPRPSEEYCQAHPRSARLA